MSVSVQVSEYQSVKVQTSPGTTLLQIAQHALGEAHKKKYLKGQAEASPGLKYKGKQLDLTLPFRLSGLPNLAKLELILPPPRPAAPSSKVRVAFDGPDGPAAGAFAPDTTLQAALDALATVGSIDLDAHAPHQPVVALGSNRVAGPALASATFRSAFGVSGGNCALSLSFEPAGSAASAPEPQPMELDNPPPAQQPPAPQGVKRALPSNKSAIPPTTQPPPELSMRVLEERLRDFEEELCAASPEVFRKSIGILVKYMRNIGNSSPHDARPRSVSLENKAFSEHVAKWRSGGLLFEALGFQLEPGSSMIYLRAEHPRFTSDALRLFEAAAARAKPANPLAPAITPSSASGNFSQAATAHERPPEPTLTELRLSKMKADKLLPIRESEVAGFDRQLAVFLPDQLPAGPEVEVSDQDFDVTGAEPSVLGSEPG